jgi:hypothetical protein
MTYNIPDQISGDTWEGIDSITLKNNNIPLNLDSADIIMQVRSNYNNLANPVYLELTTGNQEIIVLSPATNGTLSINPIVVDLPAGIYDYSLQVKFSNGHFKTYLQGKWKILPNTVRSKYKSSTRYLSDLNIYSGADTLNIIPNNPSEILQLTPLKVNSIDSGYNFDLEVSENSRRVMIAYPDAIRDLTSISYKDFMNMPVLDKFTKKTITLDRQTPYGIVKVVYKVYYYISSTAYASPVTYSVNI